MTRWIDHRRETVSDGTPYRCRKCRRTPTGQGMPVYVKYLAVPGWGCRHCGDYLKPEDLPICTLCGVEGGGHMAACLSLNPTAD